MEDKQIYDLFKQMMEQISDRNSCMTNLAKSRLSIMEDMGRMALNHGNDSNGNWAKWNEMKEQLDKIDELIIHLSNSKNV